MLPYFHIFGLTLPAYGVMLVLGFLAAAAKSLRLRAEEKHQR